MRKLWLVLAIISIALAVATVACIAVFGMKLMYAPLIASLVVAAYAFYSVPFYFSAYAKAGLCEKVVLVYTRDSLKDAHSIAAALGMKDAAVEKIIQKCIRNGYITM